MPFAPELLDGLDDEGWGALIALGRAFHVRDTSLQATLDAILLMATKTVDGADFAGVNVMRGSSFEPQAVLGEPPTELDLLQQRTGIGPCIEASREQRTIVVGEIATAGSWPEFAALAASLGVHSMLCVPMWVDEQRLGSISLFSRSEDAFDHRAELTANLLAAHAAVALVEAQRRDNLLVALKSRDVIGQAKGILMERNRITADAAFALLSAASQRTNRKLSALAEDLASTGALPQ